jgi:hypothetical protein
MEDRSRTIFARLYGHDKWQHYLFDLYAALTRTREVPMTLIRNQLIRRSADFIDIIIVHRMSDLTISIRLADRPDRH